MNKINESKNSLDKERLMTGEANKVLDNEKSNSSSEKGPLSFLSGAITSIIFAIISFWVSENAVLYFSKHTKAYDSSIAQSIASGLKTLVIGMCFLSTFTFSFIGIGLTIVFIRSLFGVRNNKDG
tara:strand:+ start:3173 stop:3547 length:375 start_codon:yes stop_codon:yes gene_type:complete